MLLRSAVQQQITSRLVNPSTIEDLRERLRCTPETAVHVLLCRIREYCTGVYSTMQQLGINITPDEATLQQLCSSMGVQLPRPHQVHLSEIADRNPVEIRKSSVVELFHLFSDAVCLIAPEAWYSLGFDLELTFARRSAPFISQLHYHRFLGGVIDQINSESPLHLQIPAIGLSSSHSEDVASSILRAFSYQTIEWCQKLSTEVYPASTFEVTNATLYPALAGQLASKAQNFAAWLLSTMHTTFQWRSWYLRMRSITNNFTEPVDAMTLAHPEIGSAPEIVTIAMLLWNYSVRWPIKQLTQQDIESAIDAHEVIEIVPSDQFKDSFLRFAALLLIQPGGNLRNLHALLSTTEDSDEELVRIYLYLMELVQPLVDALFNEQPNPLLDALDIVRSASAWLTNRRIVAVGTDTLVEFLLNLPAGEPAQEEEARPSPLVFPMARISSSAAKLITLTQLPSPDSCAKTTMTDFLNRWTIALQTIVREHMPGRPVGLISSCDQYQYAINHLVKHVNLRTARSGRVRSVICMGNVSGLLARLCLKAYPFAIIAHIACDIIDMRGQSRTITGNRGMQCPPELSSCLQHPETAHRLKLTHGVDGDMTSYTAMTNRTLHESLCATDVQVAYIDMTRIEPSNQPLVIRNILAFLETIGHFTIPVAMIWSLSSINLESVVKLLSLGLRSSLEIVGSEYLCTPCIVVSIQVTASHNIRKSCTLPLAVRTALEAATLDASVITIEAPQAMFLAVTEEWGLHSPTTLRNIIQLPTLSNLLHRCCCCKFLAQFSGNLEGQITSALSRIIESFHAESVPTEDQVDNLAILGTVMRTMGIQAASDVNSETDFLTRVELALVRVLQSLLRRHHTPTGDLSVPITGHLAFSHLSPSGHSITLDAQHIVLTIRGHRLDILNKLNEGLAVGHDLVHRVCSIVLAPVDLNVPRSSAFAVLEPQLPYLTCCVTMSRPEYLIILNQERLQVHTWLTNSIGNMSIFTRAREEVQHPGSPLYHQDDNELEPSPAYHPESPVW